ncbi:MAG: sigma-70 factor domain-containing protein, partial [Myxococcota bacterium]|nr:sigma-70 factor domain-containing protein [Myxococcota bacterium]
METEEVGSDVEVLDASGAVVSPSDRGLQLPAVSGTTDIARRQDLLAAYLSEIRRHPILDVEEERKVAIEYLETGDREAARKLVSSNLRLVVKLAFQYHRQWA